MKHWLIFATSEKNLTQVTSVLATSL